MLQHEIDAHVARFTEVPTHTDAGVRIPPTRYTVTYRDMHPDTDDIRRNFTDVHSLPVGSGDLDMALVYARHLSVKFPTTEYAVFDQRDGDHLPYYYWCGDYSGSPHGKPDGDLTIDQVIAEADAMGLLD